MTRTRYAIAMTVVMSAALCADRGVAAAAPQHRPPPASSMASRVMERLSQSLRRAVPAARVIETRREGATVQASVVNPASVIVERRPISPFQFRLPPPLS